MAPDAESAEHAGTGRAPSARTTTGAANARCAGAANAQWPSREPGAASAAVVGKADASPCPTAGPAATADTATLGDACFPPIVEEPRLPATGTASAAGGRASPVPAGRRKRAALAAPLRDACPGLPASGTSAFRARADATGLVRPWVRSATASGAAAVRLAPSAWVRSGEEDAACRPRPGRVGRQAARPPAARAAAPRAACARDGFRTPQNTPRGR